MRHTRTTTLPLIPLLGLLIACAQEPAPELRAAEKALEAATVIGADVFAGEALARSSAALRAARQELEAERKRFSIVRRYDKARELLTTVRAEAEAAASEARRRGKSEGEATRSAAAAAVALATTAVAKAFVPKNGGDYVKSRRDRLQRADAELSKAETAFAERRYADALKGFKTLAADTTRVAAEVGRSSQGFLTGVETKDSLQYSVLFLTVSGIRQEDKTKTAAGGMTLLALRFAGDSRDVPDGHFWVSGADGKRYAHVVAIGTEGGRQIVYEVPSCASEFVWHDGDQVYELQPARAARR